MDFSAAELWVYRKGEIVKAKGEIFYSFAKRASQIRIIRYVLVGVVNTGFSYGLYSLFIFGGLGVSMASLGALLLGIVFSFATQGTLVFKNATPLTFAKFVVAWGLIYFVNIGIIKELIKMGLNAYQAGALATLPTTVISYLLLSFVVFRR